MNKAKRHLYAVAKSSGVSIEEVEEEIQKAIDIGMANPDPKIQEYWRRITRNGNKPTPEQLLIFLADEMHR